MLSMWEKEKEELSCCIRLIWQYLELLGALAS